MSLCHPLDLVHCAMEYHLVFQPPASPGVPNLYIIPSVSGSDQGMYTCVARNVVGKAFVAAYLQVAQSPNTHIE